MPYDVAKLGEDLVRYCEKYYIPVEAIFEILNDQKVLPMIRGKGMEYYVHEAIGRVLTPREWVTQKLNLSAQPGSADQDISVTYRRTGDTLTVESKSAVRGSFRSGNGRTRVKAPHFNVKCHRSRSNISLVSTSNDRYHYTSFDVVVTNPLNSLYVGNTIGEEFEIVSDDELTILYGYYGVDNTTVLQNVAFQDWRFAVSKDIADENGYVPRTPLVMLVDDPHWRPLNEMPEALLRLIHEKRGR
jgi:hypothetical protein